MTDLKNLQTSTEYAVRGFYKYLYQFIPCKIRLHYDLEEAVSSMGAFFDQELTFENRLKYKATSIKYPDRKDPWLALVWNKEGLQPADNHFRRYDIRLDIKDKPYKAKSCFVKVPMNIAVISNSMTALDEFQEVFLLNVRPDDCAISATHPIIQDFNVNIMDFNMTNSMKLPRQEGTLGMVIITVILQFPVVGCIDESTGIIQAINVFIRNMQNTIIEAFTVRDKEE